MQQIAVHTRIAQGREADYDRAHAKLAPELNAAMAEAGVVNWRIWRSGRDLFHLIEVEDYRLMRIELAQNEHNLKWQKEINQYLEVADSYSGQDQGLKQVWDFESDYGRTGNA